jgi:hypothetical protein
MSTLTSAHPILLKHVAAESVLKCAPGVSPEKVWSSQRPCLVAATLLRAASEQLCRNEAPPGCRAQQSPECWPRAFVCSAVVPSQGGRAQLRGRLIVCRSECLRLWSELPALALGARCQSGRSVGSGAPEAVQWTATWLHARNVRNPSRVLEQGPDRQLTPGCCSGGVSSIDGASESRCSQNGSGGWRQQEQRRDPHPSLPAATHRHAGLLAAGAKCRTGLIQSLPHRRSVDRLRAALLMVRAASRADASQPTCSMAALRSASQRGLPLDPARPASGSPLRLPWLPHPASAPSSSSAPAPWSCSAGVFLRLDQGQAQGHAPGAWPQ